MLFFPVDLDMDFALPGNSVEEKRFLALKRLIKFLDVPEKTDVVETWSTEWELANKTVKKKQPINKQALEYLYKNETVLKDFEFQLGYRNLSW